MTDRAQTRHHSRWLCYQLTIPTVSNTSPSDVTPAFFHLIPCHPLVLISFAAKPPAEPSSSRLFFPLPHLRLRVTFLWSLFVDNGCSVEEETVPTEKGLEGKHSMKGRRGRCRTRDDHQFRPRRGNREFRGFQRLCWVGSSPSHNLLCFLNKKNVYPVKRRDALLSEFRRLPVVLPQNSYDFEYLKLRLQVSLKKTEYLVIPPKRTKR